MCQQALYKLLVTVQVHKSATSALKKFTTYCEGKFLKDIAAIKATLGTVMEAPERHTQPDPAQVGTWGIGQGRLPKGDDVRTLSSRQAHCFQLYY